MPPTSSKKAFPIVIFADGASSGNPGPGGWGTIIATPEGEVLELGGHEDSTTNNRMELFAVIRGLEQTHGLTAPTAVYTDSVYVIRGATQWSWAWRKNDWKTKEGAEVANQDLWKRLISRLGGRKIEWHYVRGHSGIAGNERVDEIAVSFSRGRPAELYRGPLLTYSVPIHDVPDDTSLPEPRPQSAQKKAPAYSYLSVVNSVPMRHSSWAECEARVKGRSGAKFKKTQSAEEEAEILATWGYDLKDVR